MSDRANARGSGQRHYGLGDAGAPERRPQRRCGGDGGFEGWWDERSLPEKVVLGIGFAILGAGLLAFFGWVFMLLWNWLMPELFGLKHVNYWKAWGLLILSSILFKGLGSGGSGRSDRKRKRQLRRYIREDQATEVSEPGEPREPAED